MNWPEELELDWVDCVLIVAIAVSGVALLFCIFPGILLCARAILLWLLVMTNPRLWTWKVWLGISLAVFLALVVVRARMER